VPHSATWSQTILRSRPTTRYVRHALYSKLGLGVAPPPSPVETDVLLKRALGERVQLVVVDEAQWLNRECFEYLRYFHDDAATAFGLVLVGGAGCYEVLRREPMLDSRLYAHRRRRDGRPCNGPADPRPGHGHHPRAPWGRCSGPLCTPRSPADRPSWWYLLDIAERVPLRLWLVIHQEQPARPPCGVLDGYPVRWHLPSRRDPAPLRLPIVMGRSPRSAHMSLVSACQ
jgi:hypothetical protein